MNKLRVALVSLALCVPAIASAFPITVDFTVTTTQSFGGGIDAGYQSGQVGSGWFTFDSALTVSGLASGSAADDLSLNWLGQSWDESTARIGWLFFNPDGSLNNFTIGGWYSGDCGVGCVYTNAPAVSDFFVTAGNGMYSSFIHTQGLAGGIYGSTAFSVRQVPEPGMLALMGIGLLGAGLLRRRRAI